MAKKNASVRRSDARDDETVDSFEVPAAILCAICGQADCAGCLPADDGSSGVIAIVPWERPGLGTWARLWATATASTRSADAFFGTLPDGALTPAVRFAILAELLAVASMIAVLAPFVALALPTLVVEAISSPEARATALRWLALGVPAVVLWMVAAHATHGAALGMGARRQGARPQRRRALRFGLYACGWDLMTGPLGIAASALSKGAGDAAQVLSLAMSVPGQASLAFLQGVHGLGADAATRARKYGTAAAIALTVLSGFVVLALLAFEI